MNSTKKTSRIAGFWYLLVAIFGSFSTMFVESKLYVSGDAAATINNILGSEQLFRFAILSNLITTICFLLLANALYKLFKSVDKDLVRLMVIFIISSVPLAFVELLKLGTFLLSSNAAYLSAFESAQLLALSQIFLDLYHQGFYISFIFFGLWMFPLGLLVFKSGSGFIPKVLGILLIVGCFGYLFRFLTFFLALNIGTFSSLLWTITIFGEVLCILWLLFIGPKEQKIASITAG